MSNQDLIREKTQIAFDHHRVGRFQEAEKLYNQILQMDPDNANILNLLGLIAFNSDRQQEAVNHLQKAIKICPCAYFYKNLGTFYVMLSDSNKAIDCFEKAIEIEPEDIDLIKELARLYRKNNDPVNYIKCYKKIVKFEPGESVHYFNIAEAYRANKDNAGAIEYYQKTIEVKPDFVEAYLRLGFILFNNMWFDESVEVYRELVKTKTNLPEAYYYLAQGLFGRYKMNFKKKLTSDLSGQTADNESKPLKNIDELEEIVAYFHKTIELNPDNIGVYIDLGNVYFELNRIQDAINCFKNVIEHNPDYIDAYYNLGIAYKFLNMPDLSIKYYKKALELNPDDSAALLNLGNILSHFYKFDEALLHYQKILETNPTYSDAYINIGALYMNIGECERAFEYYVQAMELGHDKEELYCCMGLALFYQGKIQESIDYYNKALEINPNSIKAKYNIGKSLLITGNFEKGLELYELRLLNSDFLCGNEQCALLPQSKKWRGESLEGKILYVCSEQGYGDVIQYARFIPILSSMGAKIIFKVPETFKQLYMKNDLKAEIISPSTPEELINYDYYVPLMSLPYTLGINQHNIPNSECYLKADEEKVRSYKEKYFDNNNFKIGIAWQGNLFGLANRIVPLNVFFDLAKIPDVKIYSLQKGEGVENQLNNLPDNVQITDLGKTFNDFSDTAAAIENLDLVIISDTSVAHMAGALGKPTWLLLPKVPEWRWMLDREDTPWYKSFRLFRQKEEGNWKELMGRVINELNIIGNR